MFFKYNLPTFLWATVILILTLLPANSMPPDPKWQLISFYTASHAAVFFLLEVLMLRGFTKQNLFPFLSQNAPWLTLLISIFFGAIIELLQTTMNWGRQGDVMDVLSNSIGTVAGLLLYYPVRRYRLLGNML